VSIVLDLLQYASALHLLHTTRSIWGHSRVLGTEGDALAAYRTPRVTTNDSVSSYKEASLFSNRFAPVTVPAIPTGFASKIYVTQGCARYSHAVSASHEEKHDLRCG
jgi:hypothetical protein